MVLAEDSWTERVLQFDAPAAPACEAGIRNPSAEPSRQQAWEQCRIRFWWAVLPALWMKRTQVQRPESKSGSCEGLLVEDDSGIMRSVWDGQHWSLASQSHDLRVCRLRDSSKSQVEHSTAYVNRRPLGHSSSSRFLSLIIWQAPSELRPLTRRSRLVFFPDISLKVYIMLVLVTRILLRMVVVAIAVFPRGAVLSCVLTL